MGKIREGEPQGIGALNVQVEKAQKAGDRSTMLSSLGVVILASGGPLVGEAFGSYAMVGLAFGGGIYSFC